MVMKLTPRKEEVNAILEVLESDDFETGEAMAKAVLKRAAEVLSMRDSYVLGLPEFGVAVGPYGSNKDAEKQGARLGTPFGVVTLSAPGRLEGNLDGADWKGYCTCSHAKELHLMDGSSRGKCALSRCECDKFSERKV